MIEHWVQLRCAGIHLAQYTYTWTCHIHKGSRLITHTDITQPHPPHSPPTSPQRRHISNTSPVSTGLVKPNPIIRSAPYLLHRSEPDTFHTLNQLL